MINNELKAEIICVNETFILNIKPSITNYTISLAFDLKYTFKQHVDYVTIL